jgi:NADPH-dependent 2,4-dienoyl-CoA reductase/sulfur reductase-like enzyme
MTPERVEVVVVGGGPAGLAAAIEAGRAGAQVVIVDENARPGGQIYRQLPSAFAVEDSRSSSNEQGEARELFSEADRLPIQFRGGTLVWGAFEPRVVEVIADGRCARIQADVLIVAAGAYDRPVPIPGWTLPGVLTVGGAQTLLKSQRMLPGKRILLAGTGPLLLVVASQLAKAGAGIVAVVDPVPARALLPHAWSLMTAWPMFSEGIRYRTTLLRAGVRWLAPYLLTRIEGTDQVARAVVARVDDDWRPIAGTERSFDVDTVCVGYGLLPSTELLRLLGCRMHYDPLADVWLPERTPDGETSIPGVFAVGDGAQVAGVKVALEEGRIAGFSAARLLGRLSDGDAERGKQTARDRLARLRPFSAAMTAVYRPRPGLFGLATADTLVCRCEEVTRAEIEAAISDGATSPTQVKAWTRSGMGSCQARMCALPAMHLVADAIGAPVEEVGPYTSRPPLKPVSIATLIAAFESIDAGAVPGQGAPHP